MTALSKKHRDEKVLVEVGSALKAVAPNKQMALTVVARVHLVLIKVLAEAAEVSVETTTVQVLHVVLVVEAVGDLAKAAALEAAAGLRISQKMTRSKMALEVEGLVPKVVAASGAAADLAVVVALVRAVVAAALEEVVGFQVVMMGTMVVGEVVALAAVVQKRRVEVELVIVAVKKGT